MTHYNAAIQALVDAGAMPDRIKRLRVYRGYPVPFFVAWPNGEPDFRMIDPEAIKACILGKRCWICGDQLGRNMAFVVGPLSPINRTHSEPPCHLECAKAAVRACPMMVNPNMRPHQTNLPEGHGVVPGVAIMRTPGVSAIWTVRGYRSFQAEGGILFDIG